MTDQKPGDSDPVGGQDWSDYWATDGSTGEVFVNPKGGSHPALAEYWRQIFSHADHKTRVIDLASGAGSVFAHLPENHGLELHAVDISAEALEILLQRIPGTTTTVCSAGRVPYGDGAFDLIVSQFGIEYAGIEAFSEAGRLVADGGKLAVLCHYKDGYIDQRNSGELAGALLARDSGFIDQALTLTEAAFSGNRKLLKKAKTTFSGAEQPLAKAVQQLPTGIHAHLYLGFRKLYEERRCYTASDITTWLVNMQADLEKNVDRLERMCAAALCEDDMKQIAEQLSALGMREINYSAFGTPGNERPVAWNLTASRG